MIRRIIQIDEEKCNGCGACAKACHEGAIGMVNGKAKLLRDDYCDGLGDCLPTCPTGAITFVEREAAAYDEAAVLARKQEKKPQTCGCPGSQARVLQGSPERREAAAESAAVPSQLRQWPVQIKLVPQTVPPMPTAISTRISSGGGSPSSAVPSWTGWITAKSSRRFCGTTISAV